MPRARKTQSGAKAQPVQAIRGQEYGQGVIQERMQRSMPAPNEAPVAQQQVVQSDVSAGQESVEVAAPRQPLDFGQLTDQLRGACGLLRRPDDRPDVPFNATLNDPDAAARLGLVPPSSRTGQIMRDLSARTGDPVFADLAARAGL